MYKLLRLGHDRQLILITTYLAATPISNNRNTLKFKFPKLKLAIDQYQIKYQLYSMRKTAIPDPNSPRDIYYVTKLRLSSLTLELYNTL